MDNFESVWQKLQSRNQNDFAGQRRYWLDLLRGNTTSGPPAPAPVGQLPTPTGSGPYQPISAPTGGIPTPTGSGPYQPMGNTLPTPTGSGPYQPMGAGTLRPEEWANIFSRLKGFM